MSFLIGGRKLLLAAGVTAGELTATLLYGQNMGFKARAVNDYLTSGSVVPPLLWDYNWDGREPTSLIEPPKCTGSNTDYNEKLEKAKSKATRHLILIRHGHFNNKEVADPLKTLTTLGKEQANLARNRLKDMALPYSRIIHSTLTRATETAQIISKHLPNIPLEGCDLIREGWPLIEQTPDVWKPGPRFLEDGTRLESAFRKYFYRANPNQTEDSYEVLVCHANVIRYFVFRALQLPPEAFRRFIIYNGSMTWITIEPNGRAWVSLMGDIGYVPTNKMTLLHTNL